MFLINLGSGCRFEVARQSLPNNWSFLHKHTSLETKPESLFVFQRKYHLYLRPYESIIPLKTILSFCSEDLMKVSITKHFWPALITPRLPRVPSPVKWLKWWPVSLLFISAEFCENISNEERMSLININIGVPWSRHTPLVPRHVFIRAPAPCCGEDWGAVLLITNNC